MVYTPLHDDESRDQYERPEMFLRPPIVVNSEASQLPQTHRTPSTDNRNLEIALRLSVFCFYPLNLFWSTPRS